MSRLSLTVVDDVASKQADQSHTGRAGALACVRISLNSLARRTLKLPTFRPLQPSARSSRLAGHMSLTLSLPTCPFLSTEQCTYILLHLCYSSRFR